MKTLSKAELLKDAAKKIIAEAQATLRQAGVDRVLVKTDAPVFTPDSDGKNVYSISAADEENYAIRNELRSKIFSLGYTSDELDNYMIVNETTLHSFVHNVFEAIYSAVDLLTLKKINTSVVGLA